MSSVISENRRSYYVDDDVALPPLTSLVARHASATPIVEGEPEPQHVETTYFDTVDHRLAKAQLTVRRRTGGNDAGWHLDVPGANGGRSVHLPLENADTAVPAEIRNLVWASTRGEVLEPVARIVTERTARRLIDATGQDIVEVVDDRIRAERLVEASSAMDAVASWRSVGVELRTREREVLEAVIAGLREFGVQEPDGQHELARVWGDGASPSGAGPSGKADRPSPDSPAGDVVLRYVNQQVEQIIASDPLVRLDTPESVHRMRVATRRLRSSLQTFGPVLHAESITPLRAELKWLAGELGAARDAEVMRERMLVALHEEDRQVHVGAVGSTVDVEMSEAYRAAHDGLLVALDSERYRQIVVALHRLVTEPPLTAKAERRAGRILPRRAARAWARLENLVATAHEAPTPAERDTRLHEARKAAKKARYAGETMTEFFGKPAARFAVAMEKLQEELGVHQDSVVMRSRIEGLARGPITPAAAFAYGRLHAHEEQRGELAVERFEAAWQDTREKKSLRAWIS